MSHTNYKSFKWITYDPENTSDEASIKVHNVSKIFQPVARNPTNLISIFGRARQGKSFLMNCLAGERDIFKISNLKESCTQGIDISNKWLSLSEFSRIDGGKSSSTSESIKIGFVDAEGQGDKDVSYDANLICPILLASKCVVFNWKGDLQKDLILNTLGIMNKAAQNVSQASEGSHGSQKSKKFGHLHIIFRDWQAVDSDEQSTFKTLFGLENKKESSVRDQIRVDLLESFESIRIWLFDAPTDYLQDLKKKLTFEQTSQKFRSQVRALRAAMSRQLSQPTLFAGQPLHGRDYSALIDMVAASLNKGEVIVPTSAYVAMCKQEVEKLKQDYQMEVKTALEAFVARLEQAYFSNAAPGQAFPHSGALHAEATHLVRQVSDKFDAKITELIQDISEHLRDQILASIPEQIVHINQDALKNFAAATRNLFTKWLRTARQQAETYYRKELKELEAALPVASQGNLEHLLESLYQEGQHKFFGDLSRFYEKGSSSPSDELEALEDALAVLSQSFQQTKQRLLDLNQSLTRKASGQKLEQHLRKAKDDMQAAIEVIFQSKGDFRIGISLDDLERMLNRKYNEIKLMHESHLSDFPLLAEFQSQFEQACQSMAADMNARYIALKSASLQKAKNLLLSEMDQFFRNEDLVVTEVANLDLSDLTLDSSSLSESQLLLLYDRICHNLLTYNVADFMEQMSSWFVSQASQGKTAASPVSDSLDMTREEFEEDVRLAVKEKMKDHQPMVLQIIRSYLQDALEALQGQDDEEEESMSHLTEDLDEDDFSVGQGAQENPMASEYMGFKGAHPTLSKAAATRMIKSKYDQKNSARQWAEKNLGLKLGPKKKSGSQLNKASSTNSRSAPTKSKLSVADQRRRALEYAKSLGISSPSNRDSTPPKAITRSVDNRKRSSIDSGNIDETTPLGSRKRPRGRNSLPSHSIPTSSSPRHTDPHLVPSPQLVQSPPSSVFGFDQNASPSEASKDSKRSSLTAAREAAREELQRQIEAKLSKKLTSKSSRAASKKK